MNKYYEKALNTYHDRRPVFETIIRDYLQTMDDPSVLEIGCCRNLDENSIFGDGYSSIYWADFILKSGKGKLVIVDNDADAIEKCKIILSDFIGKIDISFVVDDGLEYIKKHNDFKFIYLDGPDQPEWFTFECFRSINRCKTVVLCDDANGWEQGVGKCSRLRRHYQDYQLFKCNHIHEMIVYPLIQDNQELFRLGSLQLPYFRENKGNREFINERSVEISLGNYFLGRFADAIELGAVMPYYKDAATHKVIDPYDKWEGCIRIDGIDYDYGNKNVLSVSTIEHVGWDTGYEAKDASKGIDLLKKIIRESSNYLITFPIGGNVELDRYVRDSDLNWRIMTRRDFRSSANNWDENNDIKNFNLPYGHLDYKAGYYGNALAIVVLTNII